MLARDRRRAGTRSPSRRTSTGKATSARTFAEALAARAQAGVRVKILLDAVGSSTIGADILKTLDSGGCQVAWYNPIHWYSIGRFNNRTHRKSLIVDGRVGFTGGAGIADHWLGHAQDEDHWRDTQIRLEGPAVDAAADRIRPELAGAHAGADLGARSSIRRSSRPARTRR